MYLKLDSDLSSKFPGLRARVINIRGVSIAPVKAELEAFKGRVFGEAAKRWNLDELKDNQVFRAYRDFFWKVKVDPTKIRPASEALLRRILRGNPCQRSTRSSTPITSHPWLRAYPSAPSTQTGCMGRSS